MTSAVRVHVGLRGSTAPSSQASSDSFHVSCERFVLFPPYFPVVVCLCPPRRDEQPLVGEKRAVASFYGLYRSRRSFFFKHGLVENFSDVGERRALFLMTSVSS